MQTVWFVELLMHSVLLRTVTGKGPDRVTRSFAGMLGTMTVAYHSNAGKAKLVTGFCAKYLIALQMYNARASCFFCTCQPFFGP